MATAAEMEPAVTTMTMEEYLHTSFRPDCDFVDGVVEERNFGELTRAAPGGVGLLVSNP